LLIIQQGLAPISALSIGWHLLEQLIIASKILYSVCKMDTFAGMPLQRKHLACIHAPNALETECGEIPEHQQLVYVADWVMSFVSYQQI